jgi:Periplasmic copper-binding protein (NosD)
MQKALVAVGIGAVGFLALPSISAARTIDVFEGQSIQRAVKKAEPGDTVKVHKGIFRQAVEIKTDNLTLKGAGPVKKGGTVIQAQKHQKRCEGGAGICLFDHTDGTVIKGFLIRDFRDFGAVALLDHNTAFVRNRFVDNGEYGVAAFASRGTKFRHNVAKGSGEAGFYVGSSKRARALLKDNVARDNGVFGYFLRDASHGRVIDSEAKGNCLGIGLINTGESGGVRGWRVRGNDVRRNQKFCPPEEGAPPISGTGIALLGAKKNVIRANAVLRNRPSQDSPPFAGGIVLFSSKPLGGTVSSHNLIKRNDAHDNLPVDIRWDGKGKGNRFRLNHCDTSQPSGLCH